MSLAPDHRAHAHIYSHALVCGHCLVLQLYSHVHTESFLSPVFVNLLSWVLRFQQVLKILPVPLSLLSHMVLAAFLCRVNHRRLGWESPFSSIVLIPHHSLCFSPSCPDLQKGNYVHSEPTLIRKGSCQCLPPSGKMAFRSSDFCLAGVNSVRQGTPKRLQNLIKSFTERLLLAPDGSTPWPSWNPGVRQSPESMPVCQAPQLLPDPSAKQSPQTPMHGDWSTDIREVLTSSSENREWIPV